MFPVLLSARVAMPGVGFEPTISVFERAKTFHVVGRADTVISIIVLL
jgi:hypothetical protein